MGRTYKRDSRGRFAGGGGGGGSSGGSAKKVRYAATKTQTYSQRRAKGEAAVASKALAKAPKVSNVTDRSTKKKKTEAKGVGFVSQGGKTGAVINGKAVGASKRSAGRQASRALAIRNRAKKHNLGSLGAGFDNKKAAGLQNAYDATVISSKGLHPRSGSYVNLARVNKASAAHKAGRPGKITGAKLQK
jgi:hypothetical protein